MGANWLECAVVPSITIDPAQVFDVFLGGLEAFIEVGLRSAGEPCGGRDGFPAARLLRTLATVQEQRLSNLLHGVRD